MATREDLKQVPYQIYTPDELRKALNDQPATSTPIPNKVELEDAFGGAVIAGKNTPDYGQGRNQNFINLLANFASEEGTTPGEPDPLLIPNPLVGQSWYNLTTNTLRVYNGSSWVNSTSTIDAASVTFDDTSVSFSAGDVQTAIEQLDTGLQDHLADPTDAHDASAISVSPVVIGTNDVQAALQALESKDVTQDTVITSNANLITDHLSNTAGRHNADQIAVEAPFPTGAFNVQDVLENLDAEDSSLGVLITNNTNLINGHITDNVDAHDASAISYSNGISGLTAFDVQAAIDELATGGGGGGVEVFESSNFGSTNSVINTVNLPASFGNVGANGNKGPDIVMVIAECVVADNGYSVGDITILDWQGNQFDEASNADDEGSYVTWRENLNDGRTVEFLINYNENVNRTMLSRKGFTGTRNFFNTGSTAFWVFRVRAYKFPA